MRNIQAAVIGALCFGLFAEPLAADDVTFRGAAGGVGDVVVHASSGGAPTIPPGLAGVQLLPIDCVGRSPLLSLLPDSPRRFAVSGATRVRFPLQPGQPARSLYHFRRDASGTTSFGFFVVDPSGARIALERSGVGQNNTQNPFLSTVALETTGGAFLAATVAADGNRLFEVQLQPALVVERTPVGGSSPHKLGGLALTDSLGIAVTEGGVLRFAPAIAGPAAAVSLPPGTSWFEGSVVVSGDGSSAAFVAGSSPTSAHVWMVRDQGLPTCVSSSPAALSGAGYEPQSQSGPHLALSTDGSFCMWRTEGLTREAWIGTTRANGTGPDALVTGDPAFVDTLDNPAEFLFVSARRALFLMGEYDPQTQGVENADAFQLDLRTGPSGAIYSTLTNITSTSTASGAPFTGGELSREDGIFLLPGNRHLIAHLDGSSQQGSLLLSQLGAKPSLPSTVLPDVRSLDGIAWSAGELLFDIRRTPPQRTRELWSLRLPGPPTRRVSISDGFDFGPLNANAVGDFTMLVMSGPNRWLARLQNGGQPELFLRTPAPIALGPTIDDAGVVHTSLDISATQSLLGSWLPNGGILGVSTQGSGFFLPAM